MARCKFRTCYINLTEGEHAAQAYLKEHEPKWVIDHSLTTEHAMVCVNPETKEIRMGMRGTTNAGEDMSTNILWRAYTVINKLQ